MFTKGSSKGEGRIVFRRNRGLDEDRRRLEATLWDFKISMVRTGRASKCDLRCQREEG